ncbi:MAG: zinc-binding dehydrogenase [Acidimicrobiales bacterium]|jgi:NADPH:quinone reductase-like Zn-dependent oxidoreductase
MRAVTIVEGELRWNEHPDPTPGPCEVVVAVAAAGLNGADMVQRKGFYPAPPGWPADIPGLEFSGTVLANGEGADRFAVGDRVMAICGGGGQAEQVVVPESVLLTVPDSVDLVAAGGFPEVFSTAQDALFTQAELCEGQTVLISGAAGGVGTAAVQLAAVAGARVVATVRNPDHHDRIRELGAHEVILPDRVADYGPYDVSLELVGAPGVEAVLPHLAAGARIVVIGVGAGAKAEVNLLDVMRARATIGGSTLRSRSTEEKAAVAWLVEARAVRLLGEGAVTVPIADTFPMSEASTAYDRFAAGGKFGKVVLVNT